MWDPASARFDEHFFVGANLPWISYGGDFGANGWHPQGGLARPDATARAREVLLGLRDCGGRAVRWFLLCDGRAGLHLDRQGAVDGLDEYLLADLDAALALLEETGLAAIFVLFDFQWFRPSLLVNGVQVGGRTHLLSDPDARARFLDAVVGPVLDHAGGHPAVAAWEAINEPEWGITWLPIFRRGRVSRGVMRDVIRDVASTVHEHAGQPVTVGCASAAGLPLVTGLGLDFYQVHWYPNLRKPFDVRTSVAALRVDRPVLLGEYPTSACVQAPAEIIDAARAAGYAGALAWSAMADDEPSDRNALEAGLRAASR